MALDDLLVHIGELGRYQWYLFILACLGTVVCPVTLFSQVFFTIPTPHWCHVDQWEYSDCEEYGLDHLQCEEAQRNISIPWTEDEGYAECLMYNVTGLEFDSDRTIRDDLVEVECQNGWDFDVRDTGRTLTAKFSLVCDREALIHVSQSLFFIGSLIGCPIYGTLSDRIGRIRAWGVCLAQSLVLAVILLFPKDFWTYAVLRMLHAMPMYSLWVIPFVYISEIVGYNKRMFVGLFVEFFWAGGYLLITTASWIMRDWFYLQIVVIVVHLLTFPLLLLTPESPRWLLAKGKIEKAEAILKMIAKQNGKEMPPNYRNELLAENKLSDEGEEASQETDGPRDIFLNRTMLIWTLIFMVLWFGHGATYFVLIFISGDLGFQFYPSFFIQGAVEVPAYVFCIVLLSFVGRRNPTSFVMIVAGVASIVALPMPLGVWKALAVFTAKFAVSFTYVIIYVYTTEMYPTVVRSFGLSITAITSLIGQTISPLIIIVSHWWPPFPFVSCGVLMIIGGLLCRMLPETRGTMLPETMQEAISLGSSKIRRPTEEHRYTRA